MLEGTELLKKCRQLGDVPRSELVRECGYVSVSAEGNESLNYTAFYEALLLAKGIDLKKPKKLGRKLTHRTKVQGNGNLLVGSAYVKELGFEPGQEFEIKLGRNTVQLTAATASV
jgi:hypothetical protein